MIALPAWLLPAPAGLLALATAVVLVAAIVRGYAGFGFSAITLAGLSAFISPARIVPAIFMLEVLSSLGLLMQVRRDIDRTWLGWLATGNALAIPVGVAALAWLPERPLRLTVALLLLAAAASMRAGKALHWPADARSMLTTGLASGLVNGLAAIGGLVVALMLGAAALPPARWRATMIALFLFTDLYALVWAALYAGLSQSPQALLQPTTLGWVVCMLPPLVVGVALGRRAFANVAADIFRRRVLDLLILVAGLAVAGTLLSTAA